MRSVSDFTKSSMALTSRGAGENLAVVGDSLLGNDMTRHADRDSLACESALSGWLPVKVLVPEKKRACLTHAP